MASLRCISLSARADNFLGSPSAFELGKIASGCAHAGGSSLPRFHATHSANVLATSRGSPYPLGIDALTRFILSAEMPSIRPCTSMTVRKMKSTRSGRPSISAWL